MRIALAAVALLAFPSVSTTAVSESSTARESTPTPMQCSHPLRAQHRLVRKVFAQREWHHPEATPAQRRVEHMLVACAPGNLRGRVVTIWHEARRALYRYRTLRLVAHYRGPHGSWWAIPWPIVNCESGGSWTAYNPSGALGPYQLLGQGAPWPVHDFHDQMAHHRIARELWNASGSGPWTASRGCWG